MLSNSAKARDESELAASAAALPALLVPRSLNDPSDPSAFVREHFHTGTYSDTLKAGKSFNKGTTCLAFIYSGGVIVSVDSRASQGQVGSRSAPARKQANPPPPSVFARSTWAAKRCKR
jgi:hypothetical protein